MFALIEITPWHWMGFLMAVLVYLALDLGVFHRHAHVVKFREALLWSGIGVLLAGGFAWWIYQARGQEESVLFVTGYIIELSLSMDNVFVIALVFSYFRVASELQHRVLFWGILGALVMRGLMIGGGAALVTKFHWVLYFMGAFLIYTGGKMVLADDEDGVQPEKNPVVKLARRLYPVSGFYDGQKFLTVVGGRRALTPLALVLIVVETTDLVFAIDSIPAIFSITTKPFIVFTSNVFAILGLRSMYFLLANAIRYFRFLKVGLSLVLIFVGLKMLLPLAQAKLGLLKELQVSAGVSLGIVAGILMVSVVFSLFAGRRETRLLARKAKDAGDHSS
ncbi:MAG: TerC family protein [Verrucomicrobiota bacterium]